MFERVNFSNYYKTAIFIIMAVLMLIFIGQTADVAIMFFIAFIISASLLPVVNKLQKYMPRALSVSLILLLTIVGILLIFVPLTILTINKAAYLINLAPEYIDKLNIFLSEKALKYPYINSFDPSSLNSLGQGLSSFAGNILTQGLTAGKVIANSVVGILMVTIMIFYLCMDESYIKCAYLTFFPPKFKKKAEEILDILMEKVGGYVLAQILSMAGVGILTFLGLLICHHPHSGLIGFLAFILDIIPVVGATIAVTIGVISAFGGGFGYMVLILAVMLLAQLAQNQLLRPYLFGKFMNIHPLLIIISLLIGSKFLGVGGVILGPAFASLVCVLVNELYIKQINGSNKNK